MPLRINSYFTEFNTLKNEILSQLQIIDIFTHNKMTYFHFVFIIKLENNCGK